MSNFFIARPNFAWVMAIFIFCAGLLALPTLPVSQFPVVAPPQIAITATYPGASAQVLVDSVTSVIEEELNGAKGLLYFDSSSNSNGISQITASFEPGTDPDLAQVDIQNRLKKAEARLPSSVITQGVQVDQASSGFLMMYALTFKGDDSSKSIVRLADFGARNMNNNIRRVEGVGKLQYFGTEAAMRVWVSPEKLLSYGLSIGDINTAIRNQNVQVPAGSFGGRPADDAQELTASLVVKGFLEDPEEFGDIVLRSNADGAAVYLRDVARIELGKQDYNFETRLNGKKAIMGAVQLSPGANAIETVKAVKARAAELEENFPDDIQISFPYDTSTFVSAAIEKVIYTLVEAIVLVFLVMLLFLQNFRYTLIPTIVVPVCISGTFAVMSLMGFSVNMMTMFGMVLAIGILVDDAIVVVENVERIMVEEGLSPPAATIKAMGQVSGAIVGITLVLSAVFVPLAFMSGSVGIIYQQFSMSLAVSIMLSGILALTFTPALCATLLKPINQEEHHEKSGFFGWFNRIFAGLTSRYTVLNGKLVNRSGRFMLVYLVLVIGLGYAYVRLPESFVPTEDQGYMIVDMQLPAGATFSRTNETMKGAEQFLGQRDAVENVITIMGFSFSGMGANAGLLFPTFTDWSEREQSVLDETVAYNQFAGSISDGRSMAVTPPPIEGMGNSGGFSVRLQDRSNLGREALTNARNTLLGQANASPIIAYAMMEGLEDAPQLRINIDRKKATALGVGFESINNAVSTAYGSATVNDFANAGRLQRVVVQADVADRMTPERVLELQVLNDEGNLVPMRSFASSSWEIGPVQVSRYNGYPAYKISGSPMPGYSSGEAMAEIERIINTLPKGIGYEWTGLSYQEKAAGSQAPMLLTISIMVVFLLLVALYESWAIPLSVILIIPIGALGAVAAVFLTGMSNDVYFKVGLITIIGLSAKNAILIVEFAKDLYQQGYSLKNAAIQAAKLRFRPIIMTSMAFILGVVPLTLATGAGAASQHSLGVSVIGGMISATVLGVLFVPVFFTWVLGRVKKTPNTD
ncbi:multidrug efflux RND transporter permease subunit [Marinomonas sp. M1K-6]|uniref:Efflux pump membrane transporter n=1 Tax=Marinomonas profundi TaxID=2726122 RepID=A0A847RA21_9GAMM|nr:efflux RND transporter permease subunit [Marinomonas profundi]NLQ18027.1 multidrug efflux RND transporter permease subunit [Marinomonas profundi]UDV01749.1 multidrug efflux RND transporter permease subunit [Marinomonas profundi]